MTANRSAGWENQCPVDAVARTGPHPPQGRRGGALPTGRESSPAAGKPSTSAPEELPGEAVRLPHKSLSKMHLRQLTENAARRLNRGVAQLHRSFTPRGHQGALLAGGPTGLPASQARSARSPGVSPHTPRAARAPGPGSPGPRPHSLSGSLLGQKPRPTLPFRPRRAFGSPIPIRSATLASALSSNSFRTAP